MSNKDKDKWYVVYAKTAAHKKEWMEAFEAERERVREDHDKGVCVGVHVVHMHRLTIPQPHSLFPQT